jgi:D-arginine dehydrogenase
MLTTASKAFFEQPPFGFAEHAVVTPRGCLVVATVPEALTQVLKECSELSAGVRGVDTKEALAICPVLKPEAAACGMLDPDAKDIDVDALHQGFLKGLRARGGTVVTDAEVTGLDRRSGQWHVTTAAGSFAAPIVINAAGAWADEVAALAGVARVGLVPKRRTIVAFDPPAEHDTSAWPIVGNDSEEEGWYFLRQGGRLIGSPADETPSPPCDAQPDELDIAIAIDRIETATTLKIRRVAAKWAGLRSFVADKTIVAGFAADAEGFFWLAGQGGYGIQTSPALSRAVAALVTSGDLPADLRARGLDAAMLSPQRPALRQTAVDPAA